MLLTSTTTIIGDIEADLVVDPVPTLGVSDPSAGRPSGQLYGGKGGATVPAPVTPVDDPANVLRGDAGDNEFESMDGDNTLYGGKGSDTAIFRGDLADYIISYDPLSGYTVTDKVAGRDGTDALYGIEHLQFNDTSIPLDFAAPGSPVIVVPTPDPNLPPSLIGDAALGDVQLVDMICWTCIETDIDVVDIGMGIALTVVGVTTADAAVMQFDAI